MLYMPVGFQPSLLRVHLLPTSSTDIQAKNIIISTIDGSVFEEWDRDEQAKLSACKVDEDRVVYQSRLFSPQGELEEIWTAYSLRLW
jgi:carbamate kinase